jgi:hypothetical protein
VNKESALYNFKIMIEQSWTYGKMTKQERINWEKVLNNVRTRDCLKGNYNTRWNILQAIYMSYLIGIGYDSFNWREV